MALVALQVASRLRVLVPEQLSIIGFANLKITEFSNPPLTTVQQPFQEMGRIAVRRLPASFHDEEVNGGGKKPHKAKSPESALQVLPTRLIERGSTSTAPV
jgi:DNA-binding LacI/PurR family transcriptional regulator